MGRSRSDYPGVILAAGLSTRMGALGQKLLLPLRGSALVVHVARAALASRLAEAIVVVGAEPDRIRAALPADARLRIVENRRYAEGRSGSIRAGLEAAVERAPGSPGVLFLLGDQPLMPAALIDAVIAAAEAEDAREAGDARGAPLAVASLPGGAPLVVPTLPGGTGSEAKGNPVLFRRPLFEALRALTGDRGALALIEARWKEAALVPVRDPATQLRVETPEDYRRLLERAESGEGGDAGSRG